MSGLQQVTLLCDNPYGIEPVGKILIEAPVIERLRRYRQLLSKDSESGGILLGYRRGEHLHVTDCTSPMKTDRRSRFAFHRDGSTHQAIALQKWSDSGQLIDYLGDWHTHPEDHPAPSRTDTYGWLEITRLRVSPMVFIIVGRKSEWLGIGRAAEISEVNALPHPET